MKKSEKDNAIINSKDSIIETNNNESVISADNQDQMNYQQENNFSCPLFGQTDDNVSEKNSTKRFKASAKNKKIDSQKIFYLDDENITAVYKDNNDTEKDQSKVNKISNKSSFKSTNKYSVDNTADKNRPKLINNKEIGRLKPKNDFIRFRKNDNNVSGNAYVAMLLIHTIVDFFALSAAFGLSILLCWFVGWQVRPGGTTIAFAGTKIWDIWLYFCAISLVMMYLLGCGRSSWKYSSTTDVIRVVSGTALSTLILTAFCWTNVFMFVRVSFVIIYWFISILALCLVRFYSRAVNNFAYFFKSRNFVQNNLQRVIIYGGGYCGRMLIEQLINNPQEGMLPVAVLDDDIVKRRTTLNGLRIDCPKNNMRQIIEDTKADLIIIAISHISKKDLKNLYQRCIGFGIPVKILPAIADGRRELSTLSMEIRDVKTEELLGREEFDTSIDLMNYSIRDKVVLVTGGAGSIGSELCRLALQFGCKHLIAFDSTENSIFFLSQEFLKKYDKSKFSLVVGNIQDRQRLLSIFQKYKPDIVYHAAAFKHVPIMEFAPTEAIKNNILGTSNVIEICNEVGVDKFVLISTDKAVNPVNVMGATKRIAEMLLQSRVASSKTKLTAVRFGNVLGSNGSVVGIFLEQIKTGGPVTLTHKDVKRYFMTVSEACKLVIQAGSLGSSGEIFELDMGEPVKIYDLAEDLIKLNGLTPGKDIDIITTGLRPGEKLFEELKYSGETYDKTLHEGIFVCKLENIETKAFSSEIENLKVAVETENINLAIKTIARLIPTFILPVNSTNESIIS